MVARFQSALSTRPEVLAAYAMSGDMDYLLHVAAADFEAYADHYNRLTPFLDAYYRLIQVAVRSQGLMVAPGNPLGLLSEDTHPATGELWGNFPQTYSMVGLIQCAARLSIPWDEAY